MTLSVAATAGNTANIPAGLWELPAGWEWKRISEVAIVNPSRPNNLRNRSNIAPTSFLPMSGVDEKHGVIEELQQKPYSEVKSGYTYFEEKDILFAKITPSMENGKCTIATNLIDLIGFGSTEFHVIRVSPEVIPEWLFYYLRRIVFREEAKTHFQGAVGHKRVPDDFIKNYQIPFPPSKVYQYQIVGRLEGLLDEMRAMRATLSEMLADLNRVMDAALNQVFNTEKNTYQLEWQEVLIGQLGSISGGGTPSKANSAYWSGLIPWVTPKDMKVNKITDSQDHITDVAILNSAAKLIPAGSILIVFRSGILVHTLPIAVTEKDVTINQDLKAITLLAGYDRYYIRYALAVRAKTLLSNAVKKGSTVHSIESERFWSETIPIPAGPESLRFQKTIVAYLDGLQQEVNEARQSVETDLVRLAEAEQAVLRQAFRGEL